MSITKRSVAGNHALIICVFVMRCCLHECVCERVYVCV